MAPPCRRWVLTVFVVLLTLGGSPALWTQAQSDDPAPEFRAAWTELDVWGIPGDYFYYDQQNFPGAICTNDVRTFPGDVDISVVGPDVYPSFAYASQVVASGVTLVQVRPGGSLQTVFQSDLVFKTAFSSSPAVFPIYTFTTLPLGPTYLAVVEIYWFDELGIEEGHVFAGIDYYRPRLITPTSTVDLPVNDACYSLTPPVAVVGATQGTVNSVYPFELYYFPIGVNVNTHWDGTSLGAIPTDEYGQAVGSFRIPPAPMGPHVIRWFTSSWTVSKTFTIVPRIKLIPNAVARGQVVNVSLRGYAARETVRIRWKNGSSWQEIARVTTSSTGSANIAVTIPAWAADGPNSVRGDSTNASGDRAQTNAVEVIPHGSIQLSSNRGTVNSQVAASLANFPPNQPVTVTFRGFYETTATGTTNSAGQAVLTLNVPASPAGFHTIEATGGGATAMTTFEIVPRIKLIPGDGAPGDSVNVSLRGYGARELVRIRWKRGGVFEQIAAVTTSSSGSANVTIVVPSWAPNGPASVRGDGPIGRAQTNAFVVTGGELSDAEAVGTATATPTSTPTVAPTVDVPATPTISLEPTATVEPTQEPTATPTDEPTTPPELGPTASPTAPPEEGEP